MPEPIEWVEPAAAPASAVDSGEDGAKTLAH
jgi:hypothetical protein